MSQSKATIVVLADPQGGEDALGRLFNALAATYDFKQRNADVRLLFQGAGTRWPGVIANPDHPAHPLYRAVEDRVEGVSSGCADVFGARADAERHGFTLLAENAVPGTSGLPSLAHYVADGPVLTF